MTVFIVGAALLAAADPAHATPTPPPPTPSTSTPTAPPTTATTATPASPSPPATPGAPGTAGPAPPATGTPPTGPPGTDPLTPAQWWDPRDWDIPGIGNPIDIPGMLWDAIGSILGKLVAQAAQPLLTLLGKTLLHTPDVANNGPIHELWSRNLVLAGSLYGLLILVGGLLVMTHESVQTRYALKDIAPRMVLGLIVAATSMEVMSRMIDLSNSLSAAVLGQGIDGAGLAQQLISPMFNPGNALYLIVLALVALVLLVALLLGFVVRIMLVMLLAAVAPIALAGHATPLTEGMARIWWRAFAGTLIMQVAQSMTLIVGLRAMYAKNNTLFGAPTGDGLPAMLTGIALFWVLLKIPGWVGRAVFSGAPISGPRPGSGPIGRLARTVAAAYVLGRFAPGLGRGGPGRLGGRLGRHLARRGGGGNGPGTGGPRRRHGGGPRPGGRGGGTPWPWGPQPHEQPPGPTGRHRRPGTPGNEPVPAGRPTGRHRLPDGRHRRPGTPGSEPGPAGQPAGRHRLPDGRHRRPGDPTRREPNPATPPNGRHRRPTPGQASTTGRIPPRPTTPPLTPPRRARPPRPNTPRRTPPTSNRTTPPRPHRGATPAPRDDPRPQPPRPEAPPNLSRTASAWDDPDVERPFGHRPPNEPRPGRPSPTRLPLDDDPTP